MRRRLTLLSMRRRCITFSPSEELINTLSKLPFEALGSHAPAARSRFYVYLPISILNARRARHFFVRKRWKDGQGCIVSRFDANRTVLMATWKFSLDNIARVQGTLGSEQRKIPASLPCEYLSFFLPFLFVSLRGALFSIFPELFAFSGGGFSRKKNDDRKRALSGQTKFRLSPGGMNIFIGFCISQFCSVFPKFREVFTPWGIFKR